MTKDEARKELLETLEEYCHEHGYGLQTFAGLSDLVYTLYPLHKHMTNAEKIRAMSDRQLGEFLCLLMQHGCCGVCPAKGRRHCVDDISLWAEQDSSDDKYGCSWDELIERIGKE